MISVSGSESMFSPTTNGEPLRAAALTRSKVREGTSNGSGRSVEIQGQLIHASSPIVVDGENGRDNPEPEGMEETLSESSGTSAGTAAAQQLVPPRCSTTVETSMDTTELIQAILARQSLTTQPGRFNGG